MLDLISPAAAMSKRLGGFVAGFPADVRKHPGSLSVFEIGCGAGITTLALLQSRGDLLILAADNEPARLSQARENLSIFIEQGRIRLIEADALSPPCGTGSQDLAASAYTVHNFLETYRDQVLNEIFRVFRPSGIFVNGDRYALDDTAAHTHSDESADHVMCLGPSLTKMRGIGFDPIEVHFRDGVSTLLTAVKPAI
jgi:tRNA (cmo5U34)-methyltransferase